LSQDKFWEQWNAGEGKKDGESKPAPPKDEPAAAGSAADDILAAWLQALPPSDGSDAGAAKPSGGEAASPWPTAAAVDPFSSIAKNTAGSAASEWDLALDVDPPAPVAPPPAPPALPSASAPPAAASGLGDFSLEIGGLAGPAPAANPFAPVGAAPPAPAPQLPFGPPVPPVSPPKENLEAPILRVAVCTGRRTTEVECKGEALIGRPDATRGIHPEIDLRLDDAVSRRHAKIFIRGGIYVLTDLNSTNGTRLNGQWVQPEMELPVKPGDEIEVGELTVIRILEAPNPNA
jgi:hypothetical protein